MSDDDRFPYIELTERQDEGFLDFKWRWRIIGDPQDESRGYGGLGSGLAMTRWGAIWDAKRSFRRYLKRLDQLEHIERIPL